MKHLKKFNEASFDRIEEFIKMADKIINLDKLSNKDIASINHLQKEILKHINTIDHVFYVPPMRDIDTNDGIRYHNDDDITRLDRWIKSYLELENINHTDLSNIDMKKRVDFILKEIITSL